jgi:hypothetical protein
MLPNLATLVLHDPLVPTEVKRTLDDAQAEAKRERLFDKKEEAAITALYTYLANATNDAKDVARALRRLWGLTCFPDGASDETAQKVAAVAVRGLRSAISGKDSFVRDAPSGWMDDVETATPLSEWKEDVQHFVATTVDELLDYQAASGVIPRIPATELSPSMTLYNVPYALVMVSLQLEQLEGLRVDDSDVVNGAFTPRLFQPSTRTAPAAVDEYVASSALPSDIHYQRVDYFDAQKKRVYDFVDVGIRKLTRPRLSHEALTAAAEACHRESAECSVDEWEKLLVNVLLLNSWTAALDEVEPTLFAASSSMVVRPSSTIPQAAAWRCRTVLTYQRNYTGPPIKFGNFQIQRLPMLRVNWQRATFAERDIPDVLRAYKRDRAGLLTLRVDPFSAAKELVRTKNIAENQKRFLVSVTSTKGLVAKEHVFEVLKKDLKVVVPYVTEPPTSDSGAEKHCVEISCSQDHLFLHSLFYRVFDKRACAIIDKDGDTTGFGDAVLRFVDFVAAMTQKEYVGLEDASTFVRDQEPQFTIQNSLTQTLELARGYGFYMANGYVSRLLTYAIEDEYGDVQPELLRRVVQLDLDWTHVCATTPIDELAEALALEAKRTTLPNKASFKTKANVDQARTVHSNVITMKFPLELRAIHDKPLARHSFRELFELLQIPWMMAEPLESSAVAKLVKRWPAIHTRALFTADGVGRHPELNLRRHFFELGGSMGLRVEPSKDGGPPQAVWRPIQMVEFYSA